METQGGIKMNTIELYVRACEKAADTWIEVRKLPDYEVKVGSALFREIFQIAPHALGMYSFGEGYESGMCKVPDEIYSLPAFQIHAKAVVHMLESVLGMMISDDVSNLGSVLVALGARHIAYGVHPAHYSVLETALLRTLECALKDHWTVETRKGWAAVIKFIAKGMQAGAGAEVEVMKGERRELERQKSATLRMHVMTNSTRTAQLSRGGSMDRFKDGDGSCRRTCPPRMPSRDGAVVVGAEQRKYDSVPNLPSRDVKNDSDDLTSTACGSGAEDNSISLNESQGDRSCRRTCPPRMPSRNGAVIVGAEQRIYDSVPKFPSREVEKDSDELMSTTCVTGIEEKSIGLIESQGDGSCRRTCPPRMPSRNGAVVVGAEQQNYDSLPKLPSRDVENDSDDLTSTTCGSEIEENSTSLIESQGHEMTLIT